MSWIQWKIESLPPTGEVVLIAYESGCIGCINFFKKEEDRECYIKGMRWHQENPGAELGVIAEAIRRMDNDPILYWMICPKPPIP